MSHPRWPGFDTKTGNPIFDNQSSRLNRHMYRYVQTNLKFKSAGRKRKKQLKRVEGGNLCKLYAAVANQIVNDRRTT
jgi:hypothetical protein